MTRSRSHLAVVALLLSGCATRPHLLVQLPGGSVEYWMDGQGAPTIVLESSIGDDFMAWDSVLDSLATIGRTIAYSRGGYGDSHIEREDTLGMRTGVDIARSLHDVLGRVGATPPYILVGHSIGGLYVLNFAAEYPDEVAGIMLIDSRLPAFSPECKAADVPPCDPPATLLVSAPTNVRAELLGLQGTERSVPTAAQLGTLPVALIASEYSDMEDLRLGHGVLVRVQREFAAALRNGRFVVAEGSGHYVQRDRPDLFLAEIRRLVAAAEPS